MKNSTNWIFKIFGCVGTFVLLFIILIIIFEPISPKSDYCIEDGDCKAGRVILLENKKITINKESCTKNGFEWYERSQMCKIDVNKTRFSVKKIIYD